METDRVNFHEYLSLMSKPQKEQLNKCSPKQNKSNRIHSAKHLGIVSSGLMDHYLSSKASFYW